jgi:hypothetical protein
MDAIPAECIVQVIGKCLLNQPVFAVDIGDHRKIKLRGR